MNTESRQFHRIAIGVLSLLLVSAASHPGFAQTNVAAPTLRGPATGSTDGNLAPKLDGSNAKPAELTALRDQWDARVRDLHVRVPDATARRTAKYVSDLKTLGTRITAMGNLDALSPIRTERETYEAGKTTAGFDPKDSAVPLQARQLRSAYDADNAKISDYAASEEKNLAGAYLRQLEELERKSTAARKIADAIAVRTEKQQLQALVSEALTAPPPPTPSPIVSTNLETMRAEYRGQCEAVESEAKPLIEAAKAKYLRVLEPLHLRFAEATATAEAAVVGSEITRVKDGREENYSVRSLPMETNAARLQYEQEFLKAASLREVKLRSLESRYLEHLGAAAQALATGSRPEDLEAIHFERAMVRVADQVARKRLVKTDLVGNNTSGGQEEIPKSGALLAGFHVGEGSFSGEKIVKSIQAVFRTAAGDYDGDVHGKGNRGSDLIAKPGYAVGAVLLEPGNRLIGIQVTFMKIKSDRSSLDPRDSYQSGWLGGSVGGKRVELGGGGRLIVGSIIRSGADVDALGLAYLE